MNKAVPCISKCPSLHIGVRKPMSGYWDGDQGGGGMFCLSLNVFVSIAESVIKSLLNDN